jgi:hypothetical protein
MHHVPSPSRAQACHWQVVEPTPNTAVQAQAGTELSGLHDKDGLKARQKRSQVDSVALRRGSNVPFAAVRRKRGNGN